MVRFRNKNWELGVTRNMSLFQSCLDVAGHYLRSKNYGLPPLEHLFVVKDGSTMYAHTNKNNMDRYEKQVEEICVDPAKFKKLEKAYSKYCNDLLRASEGLEKNAGAREYKDYVEANLNLSAGLYLTTTIGKHIHKLLVNRLRLFISNLDQNELELLVSEITYPNKFTPLSESRIDLLDLCAYLQKNKINPEDIKKIPNISKRFEVYYKKYNFIPVNFNEDPWTRRDILNQLKILNKKNCKKEKSTILRSHKERNKKAEAKLGMINNAEITRLAKVLQKGTILNEYRKYIFCRASLAYRPLFKKIATENRLQDWRECWKLTPAEIFKLHFENDKKIAQVAKSRNWAGITNSASTLGYEILEMREAQPLVKEITGIKENDKIVAEREIKGIIANRGNVIGIVRVISSKRDFIKFKDGDILVTAMTSVDFIPLMERAGAFVTNEGGITSHASIVSRELNKPCVIGTKIATKVLKDGDFVEVDADSGIVKIIKKAK